MFNYGPLIGATYESLKLRSPPLMTSTGGLQPTSNSPAVTSSNSGAGAPLFPIYLPRADGLQHPYPMGIFPFSRPFFPPVSLPSGFVFPGFPSFTGSDMKFLNFHDQLKTSGSADLTSKKPIGDKQHCPLCGEKMPIDKIEDHYRLELMEIEKLYAGVLETYLSPNHLSHMIPTSTGNLATEVADNCDKPSNRGTPESSAHARFESFARIRANRRNRFQAKMYYFRHLRPASSASHLKAEDEEIDVGDSSDYSGSPRGPSESILMAKKATSDQVEAEDNRPSTTSPTEVACKCLCCNGLLFDPSISISCSHTLCKSCWNKGLALGQCPQCCGKITSGSLKKLKIETD